jgi:hypothetical protein
MSELLLQELLERSSTELLELRSRSSASQACTAKVLTNAHANYAELQKEVSAMQQQNLSVKSSSGASSVPSSTTMSDSAEVLALRRQYSEEKESHMSTKRQLSDARAVHQRLALSEAQLQETLGRLEIEAQDHCGRLIAQATAGRLVLGWTAKQLNASEDSREKLAQALQTAKAQLEAAAPTSPLVVGGGSNSQRSSSSSAIADPPLPPEVEKELRLLRRLYTEEKEQLFDARKALQELQLRCDMLEQQTAAQPSRTTPLAATPLMTPERMQPSPRVLQTFSEQEADFPVLPAPAAGNQKAPVAGFPPPPSFAPSQTDAYSAAIAAAVASAIGPQMAAMQAAIRRVEAYHEDLFHDTHHAPPQQIANPSATTDIVAGVLVDDKVSPLLIDVADGTRPKSLWPQPNSTFESDIEIPDDVHGLRLGTSNTPEANNRLATVAEVEPTRPAAAHGIIYAASGEDAMDEHRTPRLPSFCSRLVQELRSVAAQQRADLRCAVEASQEESFKSLAAQFTAMRQQYEQSESQLAAVRGMVRNLLHASTHNQKVIGGRLDSVLQAQSSVQADMMSLVEQTSSLGSALERQTSSFLLLQSSMSPLANNTNTNAQRPLSASSSSGGPLSIKSPEFAVPAAGHEERGLPAPLTTVAAEMAIGYGRQAGGSSTSREGSVASSSHQPAMTAGQQRRQSHTFDEEDDGHAWPRAATHPQQGEGDEEDDDEVLRAMRVLSGSHNSSTYAVSPMSAPKAKPSPKVSFVTPYD